MSFSEPERISVRTYLGYPSISLDRNDELDNALDLAEQNQDLTDQIKSYLTKIANHESANDADLSDVGTYKVDEIQIMIERRISARRNECRKFANRIAMLLGLEVKGDAFI